MCLDLWIWWCWPQKIRRDPILTSDSEGCSQTQTLVSTRGHSSWSWWILLFTFASNLAATYFLYFWISSSSRCYTLQHLISLWHNSCRSHRHRHFHFLVVVLCNFCHLHHHQHHHHHHHDHLPWPMSKEIWVTTRSLATSCPASRSSGRLANSFKMKQVLGEA